VAIFGAGDRVKPKETATIFKTVSDVTTWKSTRAFLEAAKKYAPIDWSLESFNGLQPITVPRRYPV